MHNFTDISKYMYKNILMKSLRVYYITHVLLTKYITYINKYIKCFWGSSRKAPYKSILLLFNYLPILIYAIFYVFESIFFKVIKISTLK